MKISMSFLLAILGLQSCKNPSGDILPAELNQYAVLKANFSSDAFEVVLLSENKNYGVPNPIRLFYSINGQVILEESRDEHSANEGYHYFKLDKEANVLDSVYVPLAGGQKTGFINEYMVHTNSNGDSDYTTWPLNGDKTAKKIVILNESLNWKEEDVIQKVEEITAKADYYFYEVISNIQPDNSGWSIKRLFYCWDGKWEVLHQKLDHLIRLDDADKMYRYRENFFYSSNDAKPNAMQNFKLKYYHKENKLKYEHSIGGGSSSFSVRGWAGTGYFDIPLLNDTLKIKKQNLIVEESKPADPYTRYYLSNGKNQSVSPFNLNIFTDPALNFALYSTSAYQVYAIRKKQK